MSDLDKILKDLQKAIDQTKKKQEAVKAATAPPSASAPFDLEEFVRTHTRQLAETAAESGVTPSDLEDVDDLVETVEEYSPENPRPVPGVSRTGTPSEIMEKLVTHLEGLPPGHTRRQFLRSLTEGGGREAPRIIFPVTEPDPELIETIIKRGPQAETGLALDSPERIYTAIEPAEGRELTDIEVKEIRDTTKRLNPGQVGSIIGNLEMQGKDKAANRLRKEVFAVYPLPKVPVLRPGAGGRETVEHRRAVRAVKEQSRQVSAIHDALRTGRTLTKADPVLAEGIATAKQKARLRVLEPRIISEEIKQVESVRQAISKFTGNFERAGVLSPNDEYTTKEQSQQISDRLSQAERNRLRRGRMTFAGIAEGDAIAEDGSLNIYADVDERAVKDTVRNLQGDDYDLPESPGASASHAEAIVEDEPARIRRTYTQGQRLAGIGRAVQVGITEARFKHEVESKYKETVGNPKAMENIRGEVGRANPTASPAELEKLVSKHVGALAKTHGEHTKAGVDYKRLREIHTGRGVVGSDAFEPSNRIAYTKALKTTRKAAREYHRQHGTWPRESELMDIIDPPEEVVARPVSPEARALARSRDMAIRRQRSAAAEQLPFRQIERRVADIVRKTGGSEDEIGQAVSELRKPLPAPESTPAPTTTPKPAAGPVTPAAGTGSSSLDDVLKQLDKAILADKDKRKGGRASIVGMLGGLAVGAAANYARGLFSRD